MPRRFLAKPPGYFILFSYRQWDSSILRQTALQNCLCLTDLSGSRRERMMRGKTAAFVILLLVSCVVSLSAQSAGDIMARTLRAQGGEPVFRAVNTIKSVGILSLPLQNNAQGTYVTYSKKARKQRLEMAVDGKRLIRATDGRIC